MENKPRRARQKGKATVALNDGFVPFHMRGMPINPDCMEPKAKNHLPANAFARPSKSRLKDDSIKPPKTKIAKIAAGRKKSKSPNPPIAKETAKPAKAKPQKKNTTVDSWGGICDNSQLDGISTFSLKFESDSSHAYSPAVNKSIISRNADDSPMITNQQGVPINVLAPINGVATSTPALGDDKPRMPRRPPVDSVRRSCNTNSDGADDMNLSRIDHADDIVGMHYSDTDEASSPLTPEKRVTARLEPPMSALRGVLLESNQKTYASPYCKSRVTDRRRMKAPTPVLDVSEEASSVALDLDNRLSSSRSTSPTSPNDSTCDVFGEAETSSSVANDDVHRKSPTADLSIRLQRASIGVFADDSRPTECSTNDVPLELDTSEPSDCAAVRIVLPRVSECDKTNDRLSTVPMDESTAPDVVEPMAPAKMIDVSDASNATQRTQRMGPRMSLDAELVDDEPHGNYLDGLHPDASPLEQLMHVCDQSDGLVKWKDILTDRASKKNGIRKLGEGSYGEVFLVHTTSCRSATDRVAMKVIPIMGDLAMNDCEQKDADEVIPEVLIARGLAQMTTPAEGGLGGTDDMYTTDNFCDVRCVNVVKGKYPPIVLKAWDTWKKKKGEACLNDRPHVFPENQLFLVFQFGNGGVDLESYRVCFVPVFTYFQLRSVAEAESIAVQLLFTLSAAEHRLQFEHRDMHIGNVLVKQTDEEFVTFGCAGGEMRVKSHGVHVCVIDFTNSRMLKGTYVLFTDLEEDEDIFKGPEVDGVDYDLQFETYRAMRTFSAGNWKTFLPITNVLWMQYIVDKLAEDTFYAPTANNDEESLAPLKLFIGALMSTYGDRDIVMVEPPSCSAVIDFVQTGRNAVNDGCTPIFEHCGVTSEELRAIRFSCPLSGVELDPDRWFTPQDME